MKKTLITLLATAACVMGADEWTLSTTDAYSGNQGGSYTGVAFTLSATDTQRFTVEGGTLDELATLCSITITERGGYDWEDRVLYITDANNVYLGASSTFTKQEGSNDAVFTFDDSITLNTANTYYAYFWKPSDKAYESWVAGETVIGSGKYYSVHCAAVGGSYTGANASNWGLMNGQKSLASTGFAPVMTIEVSSLSVPEPTTATLSLLALAGLAARRRRR
ncbi:MAG: PEP-CTERM sorting domain-containing protein [Akkermansia sp.]|nr:PEP-CTERM sorting domain-containing protein [Akkermansia sp.]